MVWKCWSNRELFLLLVVLAIIVFAVKEYTTVDIAHKIRFQFQPTSHSQGSLDIFETRSDGASTGASPRRPLYNNTLEELTSMLNNILSLPNDSPRVVYTTSCAKIKNLRACRDKSCPRPLNPDPEIRLKELMSLPQLKLSDNQRDLILSIGDSIPEDDVIFVSASSSNHYNEMQSMFHNMHTIVEPTIQKYSFVLFDIGLTEEERAMTEKHCRCHVVVFPMDKFPKHVSELHCYGWKPLIVLATMARARKLLIWQDASIRWTTKLQPLLNRADKYGQQFFRKDRGSRLPAQTLKATFDYMGEHPCAYMPYPGIPSGFQINRRDPFVVQTFLEPWARCALEASCICPTENPKDVHPCAKTSTIKIHRCHRFDQSILGMLLAKIYGEDLYKVLVPGFSYYNSDVVAVKRGMKKNYFENL